MLGMAMSWPLAEAARIADLLPTGLATAAAGFAGIAACCLLLAVLTGRGHLRWRESRGRAFNPPSPVAGMAAASAVAGNSLRLDAHDAIISELLDEIGDLQARMAQHDTAWETRGTRILAEARRRNIYLVRDKPAAGA